MILSSECEENVHNQSTYNDAMCVFTNSIQGWHYAHEGGIAMRQSKLLPSDVTKKNKPQDV